MQKITPCLWFDTQAEEAANFYVSLFPNSKITGTFYTTESGPGPVGSVLMVTFSLDGVEFQALNGGPVFNFNEAISLSVDCKDQAEVDKLWNALIADGGEESMCGWLKDKYGVSWQIVPAAINRMLLDKDSAKVARMNQAMFQMRKLDVAKLEAAFNG
jgi:predicted 3-demethylubiquinone-9 3-methyltransferase (glyoxalase superfamily)